MMREEVFSLLLLLKYIQQTAWGLGKGAGRSGSVEVDWNMKQAIVYGAWWYVMMYQQIKLMRKKKSV